MTTKLERAQHIIDTAKRKDALQRMKLVISRAMKDSTVPVRMEFRAEGAGRTVMTTILAPIVDPLN